MARKVLRYTVNLEGRDRSKTFVITEMPASQAERWAMRAFLAASREGIEIPDSVSKLGLVGLARYGLNLLGRISYGEANALMDEMMTCVTIEPSPGVVRGLVEDDIEEPATRFALRREIFKLHVDFSPGGDTST